MIVEELLGLSAALAIPPLSSTSRRHAADEAARRSDVLRGPVAQRATGTQVRCADVVSEQLARSGLRSFQLSCCPEHARPPRSEDMGCLRT